MTETIHSVLRLEWFPYAMLAAVIWNLYVTYFAAIRGDIRWARFFFGLALMAASLGTISALIT